MYSSARNIAGIPVHFFFFYKILTKAIDAYWKCLSNGFFFILRNILDNIQWGMVSLKEMTNVSWAPSLDILLSLKNIPAIGACSV